MRLPIQFLKFSAAGFVALAVAEGFSYTAIIPTLGDVWTYGYGMTHREDGTPVRQGDTITPVQAVARSQQHIEKDESGLKRCVTGSMNQIEYDILVDFTYQYGLSRTCASSMVKHVNAGRYKESCEAYTLYKFSQGRDCSNPQHWGKKGCKGVWLRNLERRDKCLMAQ